MDRVVYARKLVRSSLRSPRSPSPTFCPWLVTFSVRVTRGSFPDAYLALAGFETDEEVRFDYYKRADNFGSMKARALVGRTLLDTGVRQNNPVLAKEGEAKLHEAVAAGDTEGHAASR